MAMATATKEEALPPSSAETRSGVPVWRTLGIEPGTPFSSLGNCLHSATRDGATAGHTTSGIFAVEARCTIP